MFEANKRVKEAIARNIRRYRKLAYPGTGGKTKCARAAQVSLPQWSLWENGHRTPSERNLKRIACVLKVSEAVLCEVAPEFEGCSMKANVPEATADCVRNFIDAMTRLILCPKNGTVTSDFHDIARCCPMPPAQNAQRPTGCFTLPSWFDK